MAPITTISLLPGWFRYVLPEGVSENKPGIYEWHIDGVGSYIGQFGSIKRPKKHYSRNVARMLNGRPYKASSKDGFHRIHRELVWAHRNRVPIALTVLENVLSPLERKRREQALIAERGALNDPPFGLYRIQAD